MKYLRDHHAENNEVKKGKQIIMEPIYAECSSDQKGGYDKVLTGYKINGQNIDELVLD